MFIYATPVDYTTIAGNITFSENETQICLDVTLSDDDILEEDEDFLLSLATTDDNINVTLSPNETRVIIMNDDSRWNLMQNG